MRKFKKTVITFGIVTMFLMTVLTTSVSATYIRTKKVYELNSYQDYNGTYCYLGSFSTSGYFYAKTGYTQCCKYASCTSFAYSSAYAGFQKLDRAGTGYSNNTSYVTTSTDHLLNITNADKTVFYGEIYDGSSQYTNRLERIWITRYISKAMSKNDK